MNGFFLKNETSGTQKCFDAWSWLLLGAFLFTVIFSVWHLTTAPRLWLDEAKNIELAESFATAGKLDIEIAPGIFTGAPHLLQSTGYPATLPLALFFKIFGFGLAQARIYMLLWILATLAILYLF